MTSDEILLVRSTFAKVVPIAPEGLGDAFTNETGGAWIVAYNTLSSVMTDAAYERPA